MSSIKQAAEEMLLQTIIPFWKGLRDEENGGFYGYMDFDLKLDKQAEKGCILNSRILWFFSEAAMLTGRADLAEDARHAYQFFLKNCYDEENGGVYWSCDYTGKPQDTTKHTYNQGFAIYALSAYYRLTKDPVALTYAKKIFHLIEQHCTDSEGYLEAFTIDWWRSVVLSPSMNTGAAGSGRTFSAVLCPPGRGFPPSGRWRSICGSPLLPWRARTASWKRRAIYRPGPSVAFLSPPWSRPHRLLSARF